MVEPHHGEVLLERGWYELYDKYAAIATEVSADAVLADM